MKRLIIFLMLVMFISLVFAQDSDNIKSFTKDIDQVYGTITIKNSFLGIPTTKIAEYELLENKDSVLDAYASGTVRFYSSSKLFDNIEFLDKYDLDKRLWNKIYYNVSKKYTETNPLYIETCKTLKIMNNLSETNEDIETCFKVVNDYSVINKEREIMKEYSGEELAEGFYKWRIEAKKEKINQRIDWVGISNSVRLSEWAVWNTSWFKRKEITIQGGTGTLNNFTVLLNVTYDSDMQADMDDLRFVEGACSGLQTNELKYETDFVVNSNSAMVWVKIPTLVTGDNLICMYYNNSEVSSGEDTINAWDANYAAVYHFNDITDSKQVHNLSASAGVAFIPAVFGTGVDFDGGEFVNTSDSTDWMIGDFTVEAWAYPHNIVSTTMIGQADDTNNRWLVYAEGNVLRFNLIHGGTEEIASSSGNIVANIWQFTTVFNINGSAHYSGINHTGWGSDAYTGTLNIGSNLFIGKNGYTGESSAYMWNGTIDELRISKVARSSDWINRTHNNDKYSLVVFGSEQATTGLNIYLNTPPNNFITTDTTPTFTCNSSTIGLTSITNVTLTVYNSTNVLSYTFINTTVNGSKSANLTFTTTALADDTYNWSCIAKSDDNIIAAADNRTMKIDTTAPTINITYPINNSLIIDNFVNSVNRSLQINWTMYESNNFSVCEYKMDNAAKVNFSCGVNNSYFNLTYGYHNFTLFANDSVGNKRNYTHTFRIKYLLSLNSYNFTPMVYETDRNNYSINLSHDSTFTSILVNLYNNGTITSMTKTVDANPASFFTEQDNPLLSTGFNVIRNLYYIVNLYNTTGVYNINTSVYFYNLSVINLTQNCAGLNKSINFTLYVEKNLTRLNMMKFYGTFSYWLASGLGTIVKNISVGQDSIDSVGMCIHPNSRFKVDAIIEYDNANPNMTFVPRHYFFDNEIILGNDRNISLYVLEEDEATTCELNVEDINQNPISDAYIDIERYYPATDDYNIIQIAKTDDDGKTVGFYKTETVYYRHTIKVNNITRLVTDRQLIFSTSSYCSLTFTIGSSTDSPLTILNNYSNFLYYLKFNKSSNIFTYYWYDSDSTFESVRLAVYNLRHNESDHLLCNSTSSIETGYLYCDLGDYSLSENEAFVAYAYLTRSGKENHVDTLTVEYGEVIGVFGDYGLFLAVFVMIIAGTVFIYNMIAGIWTLTLAVFILNLIGLISLGSVFIYSLIAMALILTVILKRGDT